MLQFIVVLFAICLTDGVKNLQSGEWNKGFANFSFDLYEVIEHLILFLMLIYIKIHFQQCAQAQNVIVSPLSVAMALSLLSQAANGTTFDELSRVLYLNNDKTIVANQFHDYFESIRNNTGNSELIITNQIYVQQEIQLNKNIQDVATEKFFSSIRSVDFKRGNDTSETINSFVKNSTEGKITEIVTPKQFDGQYRVILINAIHFKSSFSRSFWKESERKMIFANSENVNDTVFPYAMRVRGFFPRVLLTDLGGVAVRLQYKESSLSLIIICPRRISFLELEQRIRDYTLFRVINEMWICRCEVEIPRFTIETELDLTDILKNVCFE